MSNTSNVDSAAIRELAGLLEDTGLTEIEYETESVRIRVAKGTTAVQAALPAAPAAAAAPAAGGAPANAAGTVTSPMVGVAYLSPEPGAANFIQPGQAVSEGDTLLLIEAMKTFNPVRATRSGKVTSILVSDAQPVEYGEPLVVIE